MKVLITGITGFVGSHLTEYILSRGDAEVIGIRRWRSRLENIRHLMKDITLKECDLRDPSSVSSTIEYVKPDLIFHLAAQSFVPTSFSGPTETMYTNVMGQLNLLEAVRKSDCDPRIMIAGSSEEYGLVLEDEIPIRETNPLRPLSPYAVSKVAQDMLGFQYFRSYGLRIIRTRGFNHTGPRRGPVFICSDFAHQITDIEKGQRKPVMKVGNLDAIRDFTDVRDMVKGYWLAVTKCREGDVYNICSNNSFSMREILNKLLTMTDVEIKLEVDESRMRPSDVPVLRGDYSKFHECTGWSPKIDFDQTLSDLLEYWRSDPGAA